MEIQDFLELSDEQKDRVVREYSEQVPFVLMGTMDEITRLYRRPELRPLIERCIIVGEGRANDDGV